MSEMTKWRKIDLSLYYYIKDSVLKPFIELEENIPLQAMGYVDGMPDNRSFVYESLTDMVPRPTDRGRGWVYFDGDEEGVVYCLRNTATFSGTPEQLERVTVYDILGSGIPNSEYIIDYMDGRVITSGTVDPCSVDYYWNYVSVVDEWAAIEAADPPVVVIDIHGSDPAGYQLGGGRKDVRKADIHIFASNTAERNDIVDTITNGLYSKGIPVYEFPEGSVLDYDGTFYGRRENMSRADVLFSREVDEENIGNMMFDKVSARHVNLPLIMTRGSNEVMLSDLNAYRSKITFDIVSYTHP